VRAWLHSHPDSLVEYLDPELDDNRVNQLRRDKFPELVGSVALSLIRTAKDRQDTPERLRQRLDSQPLPLPLAEMGCQIYEDYQRALAYRGAVDFDDLIRLALQALEADPDYLGRLRKRWPYILEDEAQDSSNLQQKILDTLSGPRGNWVRVGDPNQAIYETFTTANPGFLINFMQQPGVANCDLPNSGRSTRSIIDLANYLARWTQQEHPFLPARDALYSSPEISPTPPGDPQPNPSDDPSQIYLVEQKFTPLEELQAVADSLARWLPEHPDWTVAVLAPRNTRGFELVDELRKRKLPYEDGLLRSSSETRFSAGALGVLLRYLADPGSSRKLATVYQVWRRAEREDPAANAEIERIAGLLRKLRRVEDFVWPALQAASSTAAGWLSELAASGQPPPVIASLAAFARLVRRWQSAILLPVDQLVLTIAQDLLSEPGELALAHKLAVLLRQTSQDHPAWRLPELSEELAIIARNERRFLGFSEDDLGFDPERHKGKVVVATIHKAKGLEWDRVYLMSANNYDFPSGGEWDSYVAEKWFLRDHLNLEAEALAQLEAAHSTDNYSWYEEGHASPKARLDYIRERLRLLYVGITRARRELVVTWNSGRFPKKEMRPAVPLVALQDFWRTYLLEHSG